MQQLSLIAKYRDSVDFAVKVGGSAKGFQAASKAVIARAYYTRDRDMLVRFMEVYKNEIPSCPEETAALVLKRFLTGTNLAGWAGRGQSYRKTESAVDNFLRGIPMSKIYGTDKELFPLPKNL
jgi:hypothetical protein